MNGYKNTKKLPIVFIALLLCLSLLSSCSLTLIPTDEPSYGNSGVSVSLEDIPRFNGTDPYVVINDNVPFFTKEEITDKSFETYSSMDSLGRCGVALSSIGRDLMPNEDRGNIGQVKPSGWQTVKYDHVDGKYLYNRCHLIGFQLTGENANRENLITGTRFMNTEGMLPFENMVADYIKETGNHVMYRVTPIFKGNNLVASGVLMEAYSVEDEGDGICFNIYAYNEQPGVVIDHANGDSHEGDPSKEGGDDASQGSSEKVTEEEKEYVLNTSSKKIHLPSCSSVSDMKESNKSIVTAKKSELIRQGYEPCKQCEP